MGNTIYVVTNTKRHIVGITDKLELAQRYRELVAPLAIILTCTIDNEFFEEAIDIAEDGNKVYNGVTVYDPWKNNKNG